MPQVDHRLQRRFGLRDLGVIGNAPDRDFDRLVRVTAEAVRAPMATFAVLDFDDGISLLRSHYGTNAPVTEAVAIPIDSSFALGAMTTGNLIVHADVARHPLARAHPFITSQGVQSLLAAPVMGPAHEIIGLLAVHDRVPRIWTAAETETIMAAAHFGTQVILLRAALRTLGMVSRRDRGAV